MNDIDEAKKLLSIIWEYHPYDENKIYPKNLFLFQLITGEYILSYNGKEEKMSHDKCFERCVDIVKKIKQKEASRG